MLKDPRPYVEPKPVKLHSGTKSNCSLMPFNRLDQGSFKPESANPGAASIGMEEKTTTMDKTDLKAGNELKSKRAAEMRSESDVREERVFRFLETILSADAVSSHQSRSSEVPDYAFDFGNTLLGSDTQAASLPLLQSHDQGETDSPRWYESQDADVVVKTEPGS